MEFSARMGQNLTNGSKMKIPLTKILKLPSADQGELNHDLRNGSPPISLKTRVKPGIVRFMITIGSSRFHTQCSAWLINESPRKLDGSTALR